MSNEIINMFGQMTDLKEMLESAKAYLAAIPAPKTQDEADDIEDCRRVVQLMLGNIDPQFKKMQEKYPYARAFVGAYRANRNEGKNQ